MSRQQRRAINDDQKATRRQALLDSASTLFREKSFQDISILSIAKHTGLSKGTVYLYFKTKEALFLALLESLQDAWFDHINQSLTHRPHDAESVTRLIVQTLNEHAPLAELIGISHSILEHNVEIDILKAYKKLFVTHLQTTGQLLEQKLGYLRDGEGSTSLQLVYAAIIGAANMAILPTSNQDLYKKQKSLQHLNIDFTQALSAIIYRIIMP